MYTDDNQQNLVPNVGDGQTGSLSVDPIQYFNNAGGPTLANPLCGTFNLYNWVTGNVNGSGSAGVPGTFDETNANLLTYSLLGSYLKNVGVYSCPADPGNPAYSALGSARVRSISMQNYMNSESGAQDNAVLGNSYAFFLKTADIRHTTQLFVFLDEKASSINDGLFEQILPAVPNASSVHVQDQPSQVHNNSCGFGFVDGHAEIHQWKGPDFVAAAFSTWVRFIAIFGLPGSTVAERTDKLPVAGCLCWAVSLN